VSTSSGVTYNSANNEASVDWTTSGCSGDTVDLTLASYTGPYDTNILGWVPAKADQQEVWDFAQASGVSGSGTLTVNTPPDRFWDFENSLEPYNWIVSNSAFGRKTNKNFTSGGAASAGIDDGSGLGASTSNARISNFQFPGGAAGQIDTVSFYWLEDGTSSGGAFRFLNSDGHYECSFGSANPEWNVTTGSFGNFGSETIQVLDAPDEYNKWIKVEYDFDWNNSEYSYTITDQSGTAPQQTGTESLNFGTDVAAMQVWHHNTSFTDNSGNMAMWFDDVEISGGSMDLNKVTRYDFESGLQGWSQNNSGFQINPRSDVWTGTQAAGIEEIGGSFSGPSVVSKQTDIPQEVQDSSTPTVSFYFYADTGSTGGGFRVFNDSGSEMVSFGEDSPQWYLKDGSSSGSSGDQIASGSETGSNRWVYVEFDYQGDGTYDYFIRDLFTGGDPKQTVKTGNRNLLNTGTIGELIVENYNTGVGGFGDTGNMSFVIDDVRLVA
jgi:hypothetical protein